MFGSEISKYCQERLLLKNFEVTSNGVNVKGDVWLYDYDLKKLPFMFNKVDGNFYCHRNKLTTLLGAPKIVTGDFLCNNNRLTSLQYGPKEVGGNFYAYENFIRDLFYAPLSIGGDLQLYDNDISTLYHPFDINVLGDVLIDNIDLPKEFSKVKNLDYSLFLKYQRHFEVWDADQEFDPAAFKLLVEEIKDGLL